MITWGNEDFPDTLLSRCDNRTREDQSNTMRGTVWANNRAEIGKKVDLTEISDRHPFGQFARLDRSAYGNRDPQPTVNPLNRREVRVGPFFASFFA